MFLLFFVFDFRFILRFFFRTVALGRNRIKPVLLISKLNAQLDVMVDVILLFLKVFN